MSNPILTFLLSILILLISLSTSFHSSPFPHPPSLASTTTPKALILTAHPDDECMFFGPITRGLIREGWEVEALCLSIGDADGLGQMRSKELFESYAVFGVPAERVKALNHPKLQDGMKESWDINLITDVVVDHLAQSPVDAIISFDNFGISSHPNHIALSHSLTLIRHRLNGVKTYSLKSISIFSKYTGVGGVLLKLLEEGSDILLERLYLWNTAFYSFLYDAPPSKSSTPSSSPTLMTSTKTHMFISTPSEYLITLRAMLKHRSQMVWFRWMYVGWSRYMWMGELEEVKEAGGG